MDHDPDLHHPSGSWRWRGGVGGASVGPWQEAAYQPIAASPGLDQVNLVQVSLSDHQEESLQSTWGGGDSRTEGEPGSIKEEELDTWMLWLLLLQPAYFLYLLLFFVWIYIHIKILRWPCICFALFDLCSSAMLCHRSHVGWHVATALFIGQSVQQNIEEVMKRQK